MLPIEVIFWLAILFFSVELSAASHGLHQLQQQVKIVLSNKVKNEAPLPNIYKLAGLTHSFQGYTKLQFRMSSFLENVFVKWDLILRFC